MKSPRFRARGAAIRSMIAALALGLIAGSIGGCGQRGPLYLPEPEPAADGGDGTERGAAREESTDAAGPGDGAENEDSE
jgi:predicted small lipoprotein YifL